MNFATQPVVNTRPQLNLPAQPRQIGKQTAHASPPQIKQAAFTDGADSDEITAAALDDHADKLDDKTEQVEAELRLALMQEADSGSTAMDEPTPDESSVDLLKQIDVVVAQQKSATTTMQDLTATRAEVEATLAKLDEGVIDQKPPYSILLLDQARESLANAVAKQQSSADALISGRQAVDIAKESSNERGIALRQAKEKSAPKSPTVKIAELEQRLADEILTLRKKELAIEEYSAETVKLQIKSYEGRVAILTQDVHFAKSTLEEKLAEFDAIEATLHRQATTLQSEISIADHGLASAGHEAYISSKQSPETAARIEALKASKATAEAELNATNKQLQRIPMLRKAWERRFMVATGRATREERREWIDDNEKNISQLNRDRRVVELKIDDLRVTLSSIAASIEATPADASDAQRWHATRQAAVNRQIEKLGESLLAISKADSILKRLSLQIQGEPGRTTGEMFADWWSNAYLVWNYELTKVDETSVTVGKVLCSLLMLCFGYFAARWISRALGRRLPKLGVDEAGAHAMESLSFYALLVCFTLGSLRYANVPLTVFTFFGGAIAIGVGFGSQNILNNFISGLILLAERPIKVGDLIMIDDTYGNVTQIGARSTQIRTGENIDIVVPNSKFLENNVVNLTRRDDRLRTSITIGVAYGSNLETVIGMLKQSASEHPLVNKKPDPVVWFNDFGDNSLVFQLHFWINARTVTQMRTIETDVRLTIDRLCREKEIVIAYPQRELHFHPSSAVNVRVLTDDQQQRSAA